MDKPADVFDRDEEWADLVDFAASPLPGLRIAVVYGRRRQGKSYLLRRLADAAGGFYHLATEQAELVSLRRFGDSLAAWAGLSAGAFGFRGWEQALRTAMEVMTAAPSRDMAPLLVLDEFPYLINETPGLPSIVQGLYDTLGPGAGERSVPLRVILCGSAISVMGDLLSGTRALRGRGALDLRVRPFGYRDTRVLGNRESRRCLGSPRVHRRHPRLPGARAQPRRSRGARAVRRMARAERHAAGHAAVR